MRKRFNPLEIVDHAKDYYAVLGVERGSLPVGRTRDELKEVAEILEKAYRKAARIAHPDRPGGSEVAFRALLEAHTVLSHPISRAYYETGKKPRSIEDGAETEADWSTIGSYTPGTTADTVGYGLFLSACERAEELGLIPAFRPEDPEHAYEWDFVINGKEGKLTIAIVHDADEVLRLISGKDVESEYTLPFKIYVCVPRGGLFILRGDTQNYTDKQGVEHELRGLLRATAYSDYDFLSTTNLEDAYAFFAPGGGLETKLEKYRSGELEALQLEIDEAADQLTWKSSKDVISFDTEQLRRILAMKSYRVVEDEKAADFLDQIPD
jgi:hypothetical protein